MASYRSNPIVKSNCIGEPLIRVKRMGDTEGSRTRMSHNRIANNIKLLKLTSLEKEVIAGCLLGDGSCTISGKEYRLRIEHQARHKDYVQWKFKLLERLCLSGPQFVSAHGSYRFGTVGHPALTTLRKMFYPERCKIIPKDMTITPLMLAILFMDDGSRIHATGNISLHSYNDGDVEYLMKELDKLDVLTKPHYDGHAKCSRLYIETSSYRTFERLVKPYILQVPCMAYKLVLTP